MVVPAWLNPPLEPDVIPIRIDPGKAFGTTHPTTLLCLAAVARHLVPGQAVVDLGTGSGILAIAAAKLGAGPTLGVDIDSEAVRVARENVAANGVAERVRVEQGSLAEVLTGQFGLKEAPLVVANILAGVICDLFEQGLAQAVTPGGLLILSGLLHTQGPDIRARLQWHGLQQLAQEHIENWIAIIARRPE